MIRKPAGVPDESEDDRAARRLEEYLRARGQGEKEASEEDDEASAEDSDDSRAESDPAAPSDPPHGHQDAP